jgi:hypothetical protein
MQPEDKPKFLATLNGLAAIKPGAKLTAESLTLFWNALSHWSIEDFTAAASQLARTSEFMPNPYHFEQLRKAGRLTAGEAWASALEIARLGLYRHGHVHSDPNTEAAVRAIGGYKAIAMSSTDQTPFLERRFAEHYAAISDAEDVRQAVPQLTGPARHVVDQITKRLS